MFWKNIEMGETAFLLNEYILFEKYLQVLIDLGERHINRARTEILKEGLDKVNLSHIEPKVFMTLKLCFKDWDRLEENFKCDFNSETINLLNLLKKPYGYFYDYNSQWSLNRLKEICDKEGLKLPGEMEI